MFDNLSSKITSVLNKLTSKGRITEQDIDSTLREVRLALLEAEQAAQKISNGESEITLRAQNSYVRRLQHQIANEYGLESSSEGKEPHRSVLIHKVDV